MDDSAKLAPLFPLGDLDSFAQNLVGAVPDQAEGLALLDKVTRKLTSILDREELLRRIAQHVNRIVNYHVFTVMLWNETRQVLESVFAMHYDDAIPARLRLRLNQGITGMAAGERRPMRVGDVRKDSRYVQFDTDVEVRSELVIPLLLQDRLIGVLDLESTVPQAFTLEHERMLDTMGTYVAIALENARLYQDARENEARLQNDLNMAREIQRQLLPKGAREVPGLDLAAAYAPARELGGDFYDFHPYGEGRIGVALGDVSGKGTAAALFASLAIGIVREHIVEHPCPPAEMLTMLNTRLHAVHFDSQ